MVLWYLIGCYSFYYWWTKDFDLTTNELMAMFGIGFSGPFAWFIGLNIHDGDGKYIIFKKRK